MPAVGAGSVGECAGEAHNVAWDRGGDRWKRGCGTTGSKMNEGIV